MFSKSHYYVGFSNLTLYFYDSVSGQHYSIETTLHNVEEARTVCNLLNSAYKRVLSKEVD